MLLFQGRWTRGAAYKKGDVVYIPIYKYFKGKRSRTGVNYFMCTIEHSSGEFINPVNDEEIYWCKIHEDQSCLHDKQIPTVGHPYLACQLLSSDAELGEEANNNVTDKQKRKLNEIEREIKMAKRRKANHVDECNLSTNDSLMLLDIDLETKMFLLDKFENSKNLGGSEQAKSLAWFKTVLALPFQKYKPFDIDASDSKLKVNTYFEKVRQKLDDSIHGLEDVKDEIVEYLARKVTHPTGKGHVLALQGEAGTGKTKILKSLAEALSLPFYQINMGGLNDGSILTGHSETYVGAKPGKFVEVLSSAGCMNPIVYLDELDKISNNKSEINGILTHVLDEEQNQKFQDNYLSNINIDLSKVFFVIAFNDITKIDPIVLDRMKIINIKSPSLEAKVVIARDKILPELSQGKALDVSDELLLYIIKEKVPSEKGVRQMRKCLEKLLNKLNYLLLLGKIENFEKKLTKKFVDEVLKGERLEDSSYKMMYI